MIFFMEQVEGSPTEEAPERQMGCKRNFNGQIIRGFFMVTSVNVFKVHLRIQILVSVFIRHEKGILSKSNKGTT